MPRDQTPRRWILAGYTANLAHIEGPTYAEPILVEEVPDVVILCFRPQRWDGDNAADAQPHGPTHWAVNRIDFLKRFPALADWSEDKHRRNQEARLPASPDWVRGWNGPYEVDFSGDPWAARPCGTPGAAKVNTHMGLIESNLFRILEHCRDSIGAPPGEAHARLSEIRRHATNAKNAFDFIDNFTTIRIAE